MSISERMTLSTAWWAARRLLPRRRWRGEHGSISVGARGGSATIRNPGTPLTASLRPGRRTQLALRLPPPFNRVALPPFGPVIPGSAFLRRVLKQRRTQQLAEIADELAFEHDLIAPSLQVRLSQRASSPGWYEPETNTLVLSERWLRGRNQDASVEVLRHLVAHVDAFEREGETGHGPLFREAAQRVGARDLGTRRCVR